jgi:hypothetical protein
MGITALALVAPGDIITSAQQNIVRSNFTVLDARTGGDPGVVGNVPVSNGATSVVWTAALTAVLNALGYTPANVAGDTFTGAITAPGVNAGASGVLIVGAGGLNVSGGPIQGGLIGSGIPNVLGINIGASGAVVGTAGVNSSGPLVGTSGSFSADTLVAGSGTFGGAVGSPRFLSNVADGVTPPFVANAAQAGVVCTGVKAQYAVQADVALGIADGAVSTAAKIGNGVITAAKIGDATATPTANKIPIADGSGLLDSWVSPSAGVVPAGMGCLWSGTIAAIPAGWSRWTAMNGRIPVSAGTTFSTTFVEGTSYGSSWSHNHSTPAHAHSGSPLSVSGTTGVNSASRPERRHRDQPSRRSAHPHLQRVGRGQHGDDGSSTSGDTAWVIPMFAVVAVTKN